jgi:Tfp pilus assembly pilus retraction ATPase PilT
LTASSASTRKRGTGDPHAPRATFRFILSQRLIPRADGKGRVAAVEIMKSTPRTREYLQNGETEGKTLLDAMRDGKFDACNTSTA